MPNDYFFNSVVNEDRCELTIHMVKFTNTELTIKNDQIFIGVSGFLSRTVFLNSKYAF